MKFLTKILSVVLAIFFVIFAIGIFGELSGDFAIFSTKAVLFLTANIMPIILICICCANARKTEKAVILNIIMAIAFATMIIAAITIFAPIENLDESFLEIIISVYNFLMSTTSILLMFTLIYSVRPNNPICKTIKIIGYGILAVNVIMQIIMMVQEGISKLPNNYGELGFNFAFSLNKGNEFLTKISVFSTIALFFTAILTYITNYAFEVEVIEASQLDYSELKNQANFVVQSKINEIYKPKENEFIPDGSASEKGLMNVNNQLGINSNVGQVNNSPLKQQNTFVDRAIPTSNGPIINNSLSNQQLPTQNQNIISHNTNIANQAFPSQPSVQNMQTQNQNIISHNTNIANQTNTNQAFPSQPSVQNIPTQNQNMGSQNEGKFINNTNN